MKQLNYSIMKAFYTLLILLIPYASYSQQSYLYENFYNGFPSDWSQATNSSDGGWLIGSPNTLSSNYFNIPYLNNDISNLVIATNDDLCNCDKSSDYLIFPEIELEDDITVFLTTDIYYFERTYEESTESLTLEFKQNDKSVKDKIK